MLTGKPRTMVVAGVMSGTSADGVDVALVRISPGRAGVPKLEVLGHRGFPYAKLVRAAVLRAMDAEAISAAELARLNWRLGQVYAECVRKTCTELGVGIGGFDPDSLPKLDLVGMHGQTVYHQASAKPFAGAAVRATWQIGEPAVLREQLGVPVVSDFRSADLAAGGQGAPLVPMLDFCLFRSVKRDRVLLNLGGIANVSLLPAGCGLGDVVAFDTGPANMVLDALMVRCFGKSFDRDGRTAAVGTVLPEVLDRVMRDRYFAARAPKSCGREQFGAAFADRFVEMCGASAKPADLLATAVEITVRSVAETCRRMAPGAEVIAAGGGVRNGFLMQRLGEELGGGIRTADEFGLGAQSKEAVAFALLGWRSWFGLSGNVPSATGAAGPRVLGKVSL